MNDAVSVHPLSGVVAIRSRGRTVTFQPLDCNESEDIGYAIRDLMDDAYQRGVADERARYD